MEFRILGPVEVVHDGRAVPVGGSRERAVLALLLAAANRVVSTDRLAEDLWGSEPPARAAHSLQVFVSRLRKALREAGVDGVVVTQPPGYFAQIPPEDIDAARFESMLGTARQQLRSGAPDQAGTTLREALALWRGSALADVADGPIARAEAARLEEARLAAIEERVEADLACGRHAELAAELDALTREHPLRERLWGHRMLALYRSGRQVEALRAFRDLREFLAEEVGLEPGPELAGLETAILQQAPHLAWRAPEPLVSTVATTFAVRTPYVSRERERTDLGRRLDQAGHGRGSLVLIGGEPGVGKTRLTEEVADNAVNKGFRTLVGRCYEIDGAPPYMPFVEILEEALATAPSPEAFRALLGDDAPEAAKLLPRLGRLYSDISSPLDLPPEQERHHLFNSLRDFFARMSAAQPLFLVVDDLQWADEGTLLLLEHLAERLPRLAALMVGTYRDTEVTPGHRLGRSLENLLRRRQVERITLKRLSEDGVAALLRALSGQEPPASFVEAVHAETQGNPFFTEEVFKHLSEEGRLYDDDGGFLPAVAIGALDVPESLRLVLGRRLERLGENGRRALAAAAVVGRAFTYELLEALGELPPEPLLDALEEAERARLVAPMSEAPDEDRLLFSHELIRQTLLAGLSQPRRRRLHVLVADTLESLYADCLDDRASEIAHHLTQAGPAADRSRLLTYVQLAGHHAMRAAGYEDALRHFDSAVHMIDLAEPAQRPELFAHRALALRGLGQYDAALPDWDEARQRYEALNQRAAAARMCSESSFELWWLNRDAEALARAEQGLAYLDERATPQRVRLLAWTGATGAWVSPFEDGVGKTDDALDMAKKSGDTLLVGYALISRGLHRMAFCHHRDVLEAGREGVRLLRAQKDLWEVATLLVFMEWAALELGRIEEAAEIGREAKRLATQLGHRFTLRGHDISASVRELALRAEIRAFESTVGRHFETAAALGYRHFWSTLLSHTAFLRGDWDEALRLAEDAVAHSPHNHHTSGMDWGAYLRVLAYSHRADDVKNVLEDRQAAFPVLGQPNGYGPWFLPAAAIEAFWVIGERERAAALYPLHRELMSTTGIVLRCFTPYLLERIAGIGAAAGRRWDLAEQHFGAALRQAEELPFEIEGAETRRFYAGMLLDRNWPGDHDQARSLGEQAIALYRRIGMPRHEELIRELLNTRTP